MGINNSDMHSSNIVNLFHTAASRYPAHVAIVEGRNQITYAQLDVQVKQTAARLNEKGIRKGDRVLVFIPMRIALYRTVLAIFQIGATAVVLDEWVSKERMELCCRIARCKGFVGVFKARMLTFFSVELRTIPIRLGTSLPSGIKSRDDMEPVSKTDTALITFTTGSTGIPKAAKRTHGFLHEQFSALTEKIDPQATDVDMTILPIVLLINLGVGATSLIVPYKASKPAQMDVLRILDLMNHHRVNRLTASPFFVKQLAMKSIDHGISAPLVRKLFTGGAPVFPNEAGLYLRAFPAAEIEIIYGSTEAEPISSIRAQELIQQQSVTDGLLVGIPFRTTEVRIIRIQDHAVSCADEKELASMEMTTQTIGEIIVAGPHVLTEYFNNEETLLRNKIFISGKCWHRTGDSGYLAANGQLYLTGRCSTLIYHGGKVISPFVYENYFQTIAGVELATVIKQDDRIVLVVETKNAASKTAIAAAVDTIGLHITDIHWMDKIPRDPRHHSKIDYEKLTGLLLASYPLRKSRHLQ